MTINLVSSFGINITSNTFSILMPLMIGMFICFASAIKKIKRNQQANGIEVPRKKTIQDHFIHRQEQLKTFIAAAPKWMKIFVGLIAVYGFVNFFAMGFFLAEGAAKIQDGIYILEYKGDFVRNITLAEYNLNLARNLSLFTGHISTFYGVSMLVLYDKKAA